MAKRVCRTTHASDSPRHPTHPNHTLPCVQGIDAPNFPPAIAGSTASSRSGVARALDSNQHNLTQRSVGGEGTRGKMQRQVDGLPSPIAPTGDRTPTCERPCGTQAATRAPVDPAGDEGGGVGTGGGSSGVEWGYQERGEGGRQTRRACITATPRRAFASSTAATR